MTQVQVSRIKKFKGICVYIHVFRGDYKRSCYQRCPALSAMSSRGHYSRVIKTFQFLNNILNPFLRVLPLSRKFSKTQYDTRGMTVERFPLIPVRSARVRKGTARTKTILIVNDLCFVLSESLWKLSLSMTQKKIIITVIIIFESFREKFPKHSKTVIPLPHNSIASMTTPLTFEEVGRPLRLPKEWSSSASMNTVD